MRFRLAGQPIDDVPDKGSGFSMRWRYGWGGSVLPPLQMPGEIMRLLGAREDAIERKIVSRTDVDRIDKPFHPHVSCEHAIRAQPIFKQALRTGTKLGASEGITGKLLVTNCKKAIGDTPNR